MTVVLPPLVAAHDHREQQVLEGCRRQIAHAEVVYDEPLRGADRLQVVASRAVGVASASSH
ncbi:MAG: hypothetical protein ACE37K_15730 [Planctomycetota bacterium]